jgi:hypothetical protein
MMKWIFAALLLVNVAVAMWLLWYTESPDDANEVARAPVNPERMQLLTEPGIKLKPRPKPPEPKPVAEEIAEPPARACFRAGPFDDLEQALLTGRRLEELKVSFMRREDSRDSVTGYRVYLPPFPSRAAAEAKRKELTRLGFRDHALVLEGGKYAISLGRFSIESNARSHLRNLANKGVKAQLQAIHKTHPVYSLELTGENLAETLKDFEWGASGVSLSEYTCPAPEAAAGGE